MSARGKVPPALGLFDLVLFNLAAIINIGLLPGIAGHGRVSLGLWVIAFLLFFIPEAVAVLTLSSLHPGEGGLYLWTRQRFGALHGFLAGWSYWCSNLFYVPMQLIYMSGVLTYALSRPEWVGNKTFVAAVAISWIVVTTLANLLGLRVGRWLSNIGGLSSAAVASGLVLLGQWASAKGQVPNTPFSATSPFAVMAGLPLMCLAFQGPELASTMGDEIRSPKRNLPRAIFIAGSVALVVYIAVTASLLALLPVSEVSAVEGIMQGIAQGARRLGGSWAIVPVGATLFLATAGSLAAWYAGCSRMLLVAGGSNALPAMLGRIHARWKSPYVALLLQAGLSIALIVGPLFGSTVSDAYQVLIMATTVTSLIPFLYLFAMLISLPSARSWKRCLGVVGLLVCIASMVLAFRSPPGISSTLLFRGKLLLGVAIPVAAGLLLFYRLSIAALLTRRRPNR